MDIYKKFTFVKELKKSETEIIPKGSDLTFINGRIYFNGGQVTPAYYYYLLKLIENEEITPNYLIKSKII